MFKIGDKVKFKKGSIDTGMIDATEDDVFEIGMTIGCGPHHVRLVDFESTWSVDHFEHVKEEVMQEKKIENQPINWEGSQIDWQVGQTVWDVRYGKGIVDTLLAIPGQYPIGVVFTDGSTASYTSKGLNRCTDVYRSLFFSEPVVTAELFPPKKSFVPTLKKGDKVFIRTKSGIYPEGVVREVFSEVEDRVYISDDWHYYMKYDIESIHILGEELKFQ